MSTSHELDSGDTGEWETESPALRMLIRGGGLAGPIKHNKEKKKVKKWINEVISETEQRFEEMK